MKSVNATHYESIPTYPSKKDRKSGVLHAVIETPKTSPFKFALEPKLGIIALHTVLPRGYRWPYDYGFVPQTLGDDGDPLDILLLMDEATFSGCLVKLRLLGAIRVTKNGIENDRFIGVPQRMSGVTLRTDSYETFSDIEADERSALEGFLRDYSEAEGNDVRVTGTRERDAAIASIDRGRKAFRKK
ncbi:MAG: inorganic diphosphatase [Candidatus Velthaea sp.]